MLAGRGCQPGMLFRIFPGQQLEEFDESAAAKTRWPMFPRWEYTPDTTAKLEAQNIKVDRWPWEDAPGIDGWTKVCWLGLPRRGAIWCVLRSCFISCDTHHCLLCHPVKLPAMRVT